ncbi:MAG: putative heme protein [Candidatus Scalindua rubra]|uniref:Putative heme protein n=1 Tax=Candidatus Scalindua rubra TaxID=1872076 RepID=A0A1E3X759_9BACT|nr:MAG: putative heme protein [Candidatus Scalindua rubra]
MGDEGKISIGIRKLVLGFFPRIVLRENVKIITSPYDARLIITREEPLMEKPSTRDKVENLLSRRCTQCHTVDYILDKPEEWTNEDWLHVLHRMQSKGPALLSKDEVEAVSKYLALQRKEIRAYEMKEPEQLKMLKQTYLLKETDVKLFEKNKCVKCHTIDRILVMHRARPWSKERWTNIIKGMKEKDPEIMAEIDVEGVVNFLYELKKSQIRKGEVK